MYDRARTFSHYPLYQLRNPGNPHINMRNFIPCRKIHHSGLRQPKNRLELPDRFRRSLPINPIRVHAGNRRVHCGDGIQLLLHLLHLGPRTPHGQIISGPGRRYPGNLLRSVHIDRIPIKIPQYLNGAVASLAEIAAAPLGQPNGNCV